MKRMISNLALIALTLTISGNALAHRNGKVHRHPKKVVVVQKHHHHPVAALASIVGLAVIIDAAGNAKTESGQSVVVLDSQYQVGGKTEVIEKDGIVYIIK